ncbi:LysM peptidoglycan-binding domain-containing protein [Thiorhodococcus fuscus]|uniref:LysM peptidoglycan-binding domain-containing protein n=1 Tax=Thiorhodococcus fuscus TaxID=527200 RepID=A0ABW4YAD4_9GAMM
MSAADIGPRQHAQGQYDAASQLRRVAIGDQLSTIAERFGTTVARLESFDDLTEDRILAGRRLVVAARSSESAGDDPPIELAQGDPQSLMDEATAKGWIVISMKNDWKRIFAPDP